MPSRAEIQALIWEALEVGRYERAAVLVRMLQVLALEDLVEAVDPIRILLEAIDLPQLAVMINEEMAQARAEQESTTGRAISTQDPRSFDQT